MATAVPDCSRTVPVEITWQNRQLSTNSAPRFSRRSVSTLTFQAKHIRDLAREDWADVSMMYTFLTFDGVQFGECTCREVLAEAERQEQAAEMLSADGPQATE